jgi:antibiotic biosynthesis monooxygenase (ABM) superfamily enzyme
MNKLTQIAMKQPGYVGSNSYWEFTDNHITKYNGKIQNIYTISDWNSQYSWNLWLNSQERKVIQNEYKDVIKTEEFNLLYVNKYKEDSTFLL